MRPTTTVALAIAMGCLSSTIADAANHRHVDVTFRVPKSASTQKAKHVHPATRKPGPRALASNSTQPVLVYLNRDGGRMLGGSDDPSRNVSWIASGVRGGVVDVPAFSGSERAWSAITACVARKYSAFNVEFTDTRPSGTYSMIMVGGSPGILGMSSQVGGIAPADDGVLRNAVGYVFSANSRNDVESVCDSIVHEVGHTLGLDHVYKCEDPMSYLYGCGEKNFVDEDMSCGEYEERDCGDGKATQNSFRKLLSLVGARQGQVPQTSQPLPPVVTERPPAPVPPVVEPPSYNDDEDVDSDDYDGDYRDDYDVGQSSDDDFSTIDPYQAADSDEHNCRYEQRMLYTLGRDRYGRWVVYQQVVRVKVFHRRR